MKKSHIQDHRTLHFDEMQTQTINYYIACTKEAALDKFLKRIK